MVFQKAEDRDQLQSMVYKVPDWLIGGYLVASGFSAQWCNNNYSQTSIYFPLLRMRFDCMNENVLTI